jgi:hypothetical protein
LIRKLLAALVAAVMLLPVAASPVFADGAGACQDNGTVYKDAGVSGADSSAWGVKGTFNAQSLIGCVGPYYQQDDSATSIWVSLSDPYGVGSNPENNIVQIGVWYVPTANGGTGTLRYFWAWGQGCDTIKDVPYGRDLGAVSMASAHTFEVDRDATRWYVKIDGVIKASVDDAEVDCWSDSGARPQIMGESHDNGDQIGGYPADKYRVSNAYYNNTSSSGWAVLFPNGGSTPCTAYDSIRKCDVASTTTVDIWTLDR